ncbi:uncharacterized protein BT62DRAFT_1010941 [Guyanagaster necrorhizus]|uniref:Uncharacterized protein n=1 Tax=Guyanagaster necrorhizus TaxID=856835 RepID=A0A9P7VL50_9AGAR|nr:uncharacterized protein BT62DRAFT_1010941 [Guyanagaster necrorhizus MCA 3950]KAG7441914.1 hypothetical protein BT62DRAFT_1010941 [Guyanagaster necrorhizus MCA 3950]
MSARTATPSIFGAPNESAESSGRALGSPNTGLGRGGVGKQKEALKLRLDLNLEVEIAIQAKVNGDITLSLLYFTVWMFVHATDGQYWVPYWTVENVAYMDLRRCIFSLPQFIALFYAFFWCE